MVNRLILKWAKRLAAFFKWLVDLIKSIKFVYMLLFGVAAYLGNGLIQVKDQVKTVLDSQPKYVTEIVTEKVTVEKPTITRQIVEKCQCQPSVTVSECQDIVTEAIRKNNEIHHPGFK